MGIGGRFRLGIGSARRLGATALVVGFALLLSGCHERVTATLNVSPEPAARTVGQTITFEGVRSGGRDKLYDYKYDLDGDGVFELSTSYSIARTRTYDRPQTFRAGFIIENDSTGFFAEWNLHRYIDFEDVTILGAPTSPPTPPVPPSPPPPNVPPIANLSASPNPALTGATIQLDAGRSSDSDGRIVLYEFDLDGNGGYEESNSRPTLTTSFANPGSYLIRLRVTDDAGATATTQLRVLVESRNQPPSASFTASRDGDTIYLRAGASSDPDGQIVRYQWDFTNDGTFDSSTGIPDETTANPNAATIRLRVTDNQGATAETTRTVSASGGAGIAGPTGTASAVRRRKPSKLRFELDSVRSVRSGTPLLAGDVLVVRGQRSAGRAGFFGAPKRLDLPRRSKWALAIESKQNVRTGRTTGKGFMLISFPGEGSTCLSVSVQDGPQFHRPRGRFQVIGGTGKARRLRGVGAFSVRGVRSLRGFDPSVRGLGFASVGQARAYPRRTCGPLRKHIRRTR